MSSLRDLVLCIPGGAFLPLLRLRAGRAFVRSLWPFVRSSPLLQERELLLSAGAETRNSRITAVTAVTEGSAFYIWVEDEVGKGGSFAPVLGLWLLHVSGNTSSLRGRTSLGHLLDPQDTRAVKQA